jgi:hypothetical protein
LQQQEAKKAVKRSMWSQLTSSSPVAKEGNGKKFRFNFSAPSLQ